MIDLTLRQFKENIDKCINDVILVGDVFTIDTGKGKAVLISQDEWNSLVDAFKLCIAQDEIIQKNGLGK